MLPTIWTCNPGASADGRKLAPFRIALMVGAAWRTENETLSVTGAVVVLVEIAVMRV